jgi:hypothetical protein
MSIFENPSFYVSIFSGICFIASEILPFLPTEGNGIFHTIIKLLSNYNKQPKNDIENKNIIENEDERIEDLEEKINSILDKLNNINKNDTV